MSIKQVDAYNTNRNATISTVNLTGKKYSEVRSSPWVRNPSWPAISAASGSNKIVGLYAVWPGDGVGNGGNFFAITASGNYTVDYGDGTVTNYTGATSANYEFNYNNSAFDNTDAPVTFTASTSVVNRNSHGYTNGMTVRFYNIVTTTGISENTDYYVINATTNTFQISATTGGSAITLTNDGSAKLLPYKTAIVTITPQVGSSITSIDFNVKHSTTGLQAYSTGWLDIAIAVSTLTSITLGAGTPAVYQNYLEQVKINQTGAVTSFSYLFANCYELKSIYIDNDASSSVLDMSNMFNSCYLLTTVPLFNTAAVTTMANMFANCYSLTAVPLFNTAAVTNMAGMIQNCFSLISVPLFNTAAVTTMQSMFSGCYSLTAVPLFNTAAVTNMAGMFATCYSLTSVPLFNTAAVTNMFGMFQNCYSLTSVPLFNTVSVTTMNSMFAGCYSLTTVPLFNTAIVTTMVSMFNTCRSLTSVPLFNTVSVTTMTTMFSGCYSLTSVPQFNTSAVTNMQGMFSGCASLTTIPLFNTAAVTTMNSMLNACRALTSIPALVTTAVVNSTGFAGMLDNCTSLTRIQAKNFKFSFSVSGCKLSAAALNEIYTNLPTVTAQTITVSNNYGTASDTPSIATAKGWTVSG